MTSTQLTGSQWIGPGVRMQASGTSGYVGIYFWNSGSPELMLFVRNAGTWTQLAAAYTAPLSAGTQLRLVAVGNTISFLANGVQQVAVTDGTFTGGAPGIMANGNARPTTGPAEPLVSRLATRARTPRASSHTTLSLPTTETVRRLCGSCLRRIPHQG